mmetsp:Transcript_53959/g.107410  ORF Transcript_53959/g.107410 Transcript_53959/m.107410 type:complete len:254 (+) Transcript_53959:62-823(+)
MGCCAPGRYSDKQLAESGISSATEVDKVIHAPRTTETTKLELKQKFWSWSGDDYDVKDPTGKIYLKVSGKVFTIRDKMILLDASGNKICMIQEKIIGSSINDAQSFQIFTYKPKDRGQESTEKDDGTPVYRYAVVHQKVWNTGNNFGDQYNAYLYDNNEQKEPPLFSAFRETWRWEWDSKVNVFKGDQVVAKNGNLEECEIVAKFGMFDKNWWDNVVDDNSLYGIEMTKDLDPILNVCLAIICDAMKDKADDK